MQIEFNQETKALITRAMKLIEARSEWDIELAKAVNTLYLASTQSLESYFFAQKVLMATVEDAEAV